MSFFVVFPRCGVVQLAYNESYGIEIDDPTGHPVLPNNFVSRVPQRVLTPACFRSTAHHTCHSNNEENVFVASLHHRPARNKKNFKQVSMASILCQKQRCPCAFFGSKWSMGGRNRAQHHSSLPTWMPSIPGFFGNIDYLNLQSSPQTGHLRCQPNPLHGLEHGNLQRCRVLQKWCPWVQTKSTTGAMNSIHSSFGKIISPINHHPPMKKTVTKRRRTFCPFLPKCSPYSWWQPEIR